jgi:hypothetical protein
MDQHPTLEDLKKEHSIRKTAIKKLQKRRLNDLFIIMMPILILIVLFENHIGQYFPSSKSFIYFFTIGIAIIISIYLLIIKLMINKKQKEIDSLNNEMYKKMKLDSKK